VGIAADVPGSDLYNMILRRNTYSVSLTLSLPPHSLPHYLSRACAVPSLARSPSLSLLLQPGLESGESRLLKILYCIYVIGPDCLLL
jgi:hypothetical protein